MSSNTLNFMTPSDVKSSSDSAHSYQSSIKPANSVISAVKRKSSGQVANAKERIETGSGIGITVNSSQIIERNPRPLEYTEANMEAPISPSLMTVPIELSGDGLTCGLHFVPSMETIYPGYEIIGGFSVPSRHALLYSEIWEKFGHVATTEVLKHGSLLVTFVDELLSTVEEMRSKSFNEITKESISRWEKMISSCEDVRFNIRWLHSKFEYIQKEYAALREFPDFSYPVLVLEEQQLVEEGLSLGLMKENFDNKVSTYLQKVGTWARREKKLLGDFL